MTATPQMPIRHIFGLVLAFLTAIPQAWADRSDWVTADFASVRLISALTGSSGTGALRLGLEFDLADSWKIYWRSPGDAGVAPMIDWSASQNVIPGDISWPVPHRFSLFGIETFGYDGHVVLPVSAQAQDPAQPVRLDIRVDYLACSDICIPADARLTLDLPPGGLPGVFAHKIGKALSQVPPIGNDGPIRLQSAGFIKTDTGSAYLDVSVVTDVPVTDPDILVEYRDGVTVSRPRLLKRDGGVYRLRSDVLGLDENERLDGRQVTLTYTDPPHAVEVPVTVSADMQTVRTGPQRSLILILGFALLGGLILNVMPCVLPVLSVKLLSVVRQGGNSGSARTNFLAGAAGIISSFWLIALGLLAFQAAGGAIGWGIQFQSPLFLTVMTIMVTLFAANLWGLFEISAPQAALDRANAIIDKAPRNSPGYHYATGVFATLLATPCSAPFLGTAVGFALAAGPVEILLVFTALGVGLAAPYLLIAAVPSLTEKLPGPGGWMRNVQRILSLALLATALWLISVLAVSIGRTGTVVVAALLAAAVLTLAGRRRAPARRRPLFTAATSLLVLIALFTPGLSPPPDAARPPDQAWRKLDPLLIRDHLRAGEVVFVDVTADWCITCEVNKRLVLDDPSVVPVLADLTLFRGDWTQPDQTIADYLAGFGRYGIPFNVVYGPGAPDGIVLPELLTKERVFKAIKQAQ